MDETFDYVVVGAGSAGCALAARLSESGARSVLVLEAGSDERWIWLRIPLGVGIVLRSNRGHWRFFTEEEEQLGGRRIFWPRGRMIGGSSGINGMIWVRGEPAEYDHWAALGCAGWSYADVAPVFRRMETYASGDPAWRGTDGPVRIWRYAPPDPLSEAFRLACTEAGVPATDDYNGPRYEGVGYLQYNIDRGFRHGAREAYLRPAGGRSNLVVRPGALAERILVEEGRASGVVYEAQGVQRTVKARCEVICCAGSVQTPQLLELSGIGDGARLQSLGIPVVADLPAVGENCRDHLMARLSFRCTRPITLNDILNSPWRKAAMGLRYLARRDGIMSSPTATVHALARTDPEQPRPVVKVQVHHLSSEDPRDPTKWRWDPYPGFGIGTFVLRPQSVGSVHIRSTDPREHPVMRANYLTHPVDRELLVAGLRLARRISSQPALKPLIEQETRPGTAVQSDEDLLAHAAASGQTSYHPIGTCRMGSDSGAVVDPLLRVRGLDGLRVADASVMPTMVSSNTNAAAMMIGERCADFLQRDHGN